MKRVQSAEHRAKRMASLRAYKKTPAHRAAISASMLARRASTFWSKVDKSGECWLWTGRLVAGYGHARYGNQSLAHRVAYVLTNGPIPDGLTLDHLCRNRACVKPDHLEPVTAVENVRRGAGSGHALWERASHCRNGHPYDEANTYRHGDRIACRTCRLASSRRYRERTAA